MALSIAPIKNDFLHSANVSLENLKNTPEGINSWQRILLKDLLMFLINTEGDNELLMVGRDS